MYDFFEKLEGGGCAKFLIRIDEMGQKDKRVFKCALASKVTMIAYIYTQK